MYESDIPFLALRALLRRESIDWFTAFGFEGGDLEDAFLIGVIYDGKKSGKGNDRERQLVITSQCFIIGRELTLTEAVEFAQEQKVMRYAFTQWGVEALNLRTLDDYSPLLKTRTLADVQKSGREYGEWKDKFKRRYKKRRLSADYFNIPNLIH